MAPHLMHSSHGQKGTSTRTIHPAQRHLPLPTIKFRVSREACKDYTGAKTVSVPSPFLQFVPSTDACMHVTLFFNKKRYGGIVNIHGLGSALQMACGLALQVQKEMGGPNKVELAPRTSTVKLIDDFEPCDNVSGTCIEPLDNPLHSLKSSRAHPCLNDQRQHTGERTTHADSIQQRHTHPTATHTRTMMKKSPPQKNKGEKITLECISSFIFLSHTRCWCTDLLLPIRSSHDTQIECLDNLPVCFSVFPLQILHELLPAVHNDLQTSL